MIKSLNKAFYAAELRFNKQPMDKMYNTVIGGTISRGRINRILGEIHSPYLKKILDVGCEAGYISIKLSEKEANVFSFDICRSALICFKGKKNVHNAKTFLAAAQKIPLKENYFDYVICTEVIEYIPALKIALKEMKRVLKHGGHVIITFPNEPLRRILYPIARLLGLKMSKETQVSINEYKFKEVIALCKQEFKLEKKYSWPPLLPVTRFIICRKD